MLHLSSVQQMCTNLTFKFVHILFVQPETFTKVTPPPSKKKRKKDFFCLLSETSIKDILSI